MTVNLGPSLRQHHDLLDRAFAAFPTAQSRYDRGDVTGAVAELRSARDVLARRAAADSARGEELLKQAAEEDESARLLRQAASVLEYTASR